jgi:formylglycine-generating enzyme required for sulfatase activity
MGSPACEDGRDESEGPLHEVVFAAGFWMFETACTEALWQAVMGRLTTGWQHRGPPFPVRHPSWLDTHRFVDTVNALCPGLQLALPSEAAWEYACRAGTDTPYSFGATITPADICHDCDTPVPAGTLPPNGWGLREMHGNVWEWCEDDWHDTYCGAPTDGSAWIDLHGRAAARVIRGGCWLDEAHVVRASSRGFNPPTHGDPLLGFRCVRAS